MGPPFPFNTEIFVSADILALGLAEPVVRLASEWPGYERATAPADRPAAEAAIVGLYRLVGVEEPRLVWIDSPAAVGPPDEDVCEPMREKIAEAHGGPAPGAWLLPVLRGDDPAGESGRWERLARRATWWRATARRREVWEQRLVLWRELVASCGGWWPFERVCVVSERPIEVHVEPWRERGPADVRLHRRDGPAMRYRDGWCLYALHGRVVGEDIVRGERTGTPPAGVRSDLAELIERSDSWDIPGMDFRGADLRGVRFPPRTNLIRADFSGADLRYADLSGAEPSGNGVYANFTDAKFVGADLRGADLGLVPDFSGADLTDADLAEVDFGGAPECGFSVFIEAKLLRTVFTGSRLLGAYFTGADVSGADFTDVSFWVETEHASIAEQVSMAVSRFGGATWDSATIWPNDRLAEVFGQASDPATEGTFRVRDEPPSDVVRQPPEGASVRRNDGDVFFDFNR